MILKQRDNPGNKTRKRIRKEIRHFTGRAWIVYERSKEHDDTALSDIWIQAIDGTGAKC
jgi:hypothetical protein